MVEVDGDRAGLERKGGEAEAEECEEGGEGGVGACVGVCWVSVEMLEAEEGGVLCRERVVGWIFRWEGWEGYWIWRRRLDDCEGGGCWGRGCLSFIGSDAKRTWAEGGG